VDDAPEWYSGVSKLGRDVLESNTYAGLAKLSSVHSKPAEFHWEAGHPLESFQARFRRAFLYIPISATKQDEAYPLPQFNPTMYSPPCMRQDADVRTVGNQHPAAVSVYHPI
jgi:hypothetical protein